MSKRKKGKHFTNSRHDKHNNNSKLEENTIRNDYNLIYEENFLNKENIKKESIKTKKDNSLDLKMNPPMSTRNRENLEKMIKAIKKDSKEEKSKKNKDIETIINEEQIDLEKIFGNELEELEEKEKNIDNDNINDDNINKRSDKKKKNKRNNKKNNKKKKGRFKSFIITLIQLLLIGVMIYSGVIIYKWYRENQDNAEIKEELAKAVEIVEGTGEKENNALDANNYNIDFAKLKSINSDTVGWLKVNNTNIEYAVVKSKDNDFYLNHSFYKKENGAGWVFADYRNKIDGSDKNTIIYGHNRRDASMFGTLKDTFNKEWYQNEDNQTIVFITPNEKANYKIFSIYQIEAEDYYISTGFESVEAYKQFLNKLKFRSYYDFGVEVDENSSILTLSTCSIANHRTVLHAKKVD